MPPFLVCRGLSDRDRHFAEMRAALHVGKRLLRLIEREGFVDHRLHAMNHDGMDWHGQTRRWQVRGVTFDEAFRRGTGGAAQVLSGNGDPGDRAQR
jgi:hypothetical protein